MADRPEEQPALQSESRDVNGDPETIGKAATNQSSSDSDEKAAETAPQAAKTGAPQEEKKPSKLKQLWTKTGLDTITIMLMFKGSLPPIIALAMYQARPIVDEYQTLGYLLAISSILGFCIMPRGKFFQTMFLNVIGVCVGAAINFLALYSAVKAREHTTPPGTPPQLASAYNSSASAVCAIWLIVQVYFINALRAERPQFLFPSILLTIFVNVSMTYGVVMPNVAAAVAFETRLLKTFLSGFAIATGVSLLVFPTSSRKVVLKEMTGYLMLMNGCLKTQTAYMASLEDADPVKLKEQREAVAKGKKQKKKDEQPHGVLETPVAAKVQEMIQKLAELHTKLSADLVGAKREVAIGKLESHDLTELTRLMRMVFLPILGLGAMVTLVDRGATAMGIDKEDGTEQELEDRHTKLDNLHWLMKELHGPFATMNGMLDGAFQHVLLTLELVKPPKKKATDEESTGDAPPRPGTSGYTEYFKQKVDDFYGGKQESLREWCHGRGIELPPDFFEASFKMPEELRAKNDRLRDHHQRQLFFTLYLEYLLWRVGTGMLDLVLYVDKRKQEGAFNKSKIIFPGSKTLYKWAKATFGQEDISQEDSFDWDSGATQSIYLGTEFQTKRDPEHLPPQTALEKFGTALRVIPTFFRSESSSFGFRTVAATMTLGIVCYLEATQSFFLKNRLLWAQIMIALSMTRTAGQSIFNFVLRILGTTIAMVASYIIWYIVDGKKPGVFIFLWLGTFMAFYVVLKMPKLIAIGILSMVTCVLIIGYELQVQVIGVAASEKTGQAAYPVFELAPYRLATVSGGIFIAFIWTIFPFPISESTELRKDLSASLYLMSSFYSIMHETVSARLHGYAGEVKTKGTHAYHLEKARIKVFSQLVGILQNLQTNSAFSKFQVRLGGKFPRKEYEELILCVRRLLLWTSLASFSSTTLDTSGKSDAEMSQWSTDLRKIMASIQLTSHKTTSILSLLSSSLSNAQPLPPYLEVPQPFQFVKIVESFDEDILNIRHIAEPEYSAFAVMQIVAGNINYDVIKIVEHVKNLVGEIDFAFHSIKTNSDGSEGSSNVDLTDDKGKVE